MRARAVGGLLPHDGAIKAGPKTQHHRAPGGDALAEDPDCAGGLVAANINRPSPRAAGPPAARAGGADAGLDRATEIPENHTIFIILRTIYRGTPC